MAANRIIDRQIDARNPRTADRELVTGAVSVRTAWTGAAVALVVFLAAAALLNPLCLVLAPLAVVPLVVYPYGKRFTDFPHAILGARPGGRPGRRLARGHRHLRRLRAGLAARRGRRPVDRRLRPDLRLPGRRDRPGDRRAQRPRPVRAALRAARLHRRARGDVRAVRLVRRAGRVRLALVDRAGADRGRVRLPAPGGHPDRPVPRSTGRSSPPTASSASRCSCSRCSTWWSGSTCAPDAQHPAVRPRLPVGRAAGAVSPGPPGWGSGRSPGSSRWCPRTASATPSRWSATASSSAGPNDGTAARSATKRRHRRPPAPGGQARPPPTPARPARRPAPAPGCARPRWRRSRSSEARSLYQESRSLPRAAISRSSGWWYTASGSGRPVTNSISGYDTYAAEVARRSSTYSGHAGGRRSPSSTASARSREVVADRIGERSRQRAGIRRRGCPPRLARSSRRSGPEKPGGGPVPRRAAATASRRAAPGSAPGSAGPGRRRRRRSGRTR